MKNKKTINIIFFLGFFVLFGFLGTVSKASGPYDCGEVGGSCEMSTCGGQLDYIAKVGQDVGDYCINQLNAEISDNAHCCVTVSGSCSGKCDDSQPSGYEGDSSGDQYCKVQQGKDKCWKEEVKKDTSCDDAGGTCVDVCDSGIVFSAGNSQCLASEFCCDTGGATTCTGQGYSCITTTCSGTAHGGLDKTCKTGETCCESGSSQNACQAATYSCIAQSSTCSGSVKSLDCDTAQEKCCDSGDNPDPGTGIEIPSDTGLPDPADGIKGILSGFLNWILTIFLILALIAFVVTGIMYLVAMGNSHGDQVESAKNGFKYAILAVVIVGASLLIIRTIDNFLMGIL